MTRIIERRRGNDDALVKALNAHDLETIMATTVMPEIRPPELQLFHPWTTRIIVVGLFAGAILITAGAVIALGRK